MPSQLSAAVQERNTMNGFAKVSGQVSAEVISAAAGAATLRPVSWAAAAIAAVSLAAVTGCSASSHAGPAPAVTVTVAASSPASAAAPVTAPSPTAAASPSAQPSAPAPGAIPTLGRLAGIFAHGTGFGQVKPSKIFNGGDPTGLVTRIAWQSWGGSRAVGTGMNDYVGPGQSVAAGTEEPATVVAFDLGTCDGKLMYRAVEWYFPQHGQSFSARQYEDICTGSYVPAP
jgi:hypothetical protein